MRTDIVRCICGAPIEDGHCAEACAPHGVCSCQCVETRCPRCHGQGSWQHQHYGTPTCPEPSVDCSYCGGDGWVA